MGRQYRHDESETNRLTDIWMTTVNSSGSALAKCWCRGMYVGACGLYTGVWSKSMYVEIDEVLSNKLRLYFDRESVLQGESHACSIVPVAVERMRSTDDRQGCQFRLQG